MDDLMRNDQKDDDDNSKVDHLVPFRDQLRKALQSKQSMGYKGSGKEKQGFSLGTIMDLTNCLLNIMLAALYIASTYKPHELAMQDLKSGHWYAIFLLLSHIFFLLEYLMRVYASEDVRKYIVTMESLVNIVTVFPFIVVTYTIDDPKSSWRFFVRMLDLMRIMILLRITQYIENELSRELIKIMIGGNLVSLKIFSTCSNYLLHRLHSLA